MERLGSLAVLGGLLIVLSASSWLLGRAAAALGVRVPRAVQVAAVLGPCLFLLPFLTGGVHLTSTDLLTAGPVPGVAAVEDAERYLLINDPTFQFIPWEAELRRLLRRPSPAFWSDRLEGGSSPWVNPQAQVLSPVAWVARLFPLEHFFVVKVAVQSTICLLGVWVLARRLGASGATSFAAACAATLGGGMIPWALFPHTGAAAWVPWITAGLVVLARRPRAGAWLVTSAAFAALLMAGHPEVAFAAGVAGGVVGLGLRTRRLSWIRLAAWWGSSAVVGFALAAPVLLPFLAALPGSQRAFEMGAETFRWPTLGWHPRTWFLESDRRLLLAALHPHAMGIPFRETFRGSLNWLEAGAATLGVWTLAGVALATARLRLIATPLLGFGAFALLAAAGFEPLVWILRRLPPFSVTAYPRLLLVGSILLCVAAALGWDAVRRRRPSGVMIFALLSAGVGSVLSVPGGWVASIAAWSVVGWMAWRGDGVRNAGKERPRDVDGSSDRPRRNITLWSAVGVGLVLFSLAPWAWQMLPTSRPDTFYPSSPVFDQLAATLETSPARPGARVLGTDYLGYPSMLSMYGLAQTRPHNPMSPQHYLEVLDAAFGFSPDVDNYFASVERLSSPWLDFLGIAAVWTLAAAEGDDGLEAIGLDKAGSFGPFAVFRNPDAAPPWRLESRWRSLESESEHGHVDGLRAWRPEEGVLVSGTDLPPASGHPDPPRALEPRSYRAGRVELELGQSPRAMAQLLVTNWPGPAGWSVRWQGADGRGGAAERVRVQGAFLGAWIPPEAGRVIVRYVPPGWRAGVLMSIVAGLAWGVVAFRVCRRRYGSTTDGQVGFSSG